jgi:GT2 family glycosyltransferase
MGMSGGLGGFCYCIKKKTKEIIGYFDEVFEKGNFEESDYNARIDFLGYKEARVKSAYVHHFGQRSR